MLLFLSIVFGVYVLGVLGLAYGWARTMEQPLPSPDLGRSVTVILPFRNEAAVLPILVTDLKSQTYEKAKVSFVLVDDHSEDNSTDLVRAAVGGDQRFSVIALATGETGKKQAITKGVSETGADIIVTTDADCRVQPQWLKTITSAFSTQQTRMVVGPVRLTGHNFFQRLQAMEFSSLVGTAGATLSFGVGSMCNGANLAFLRESFLEVGGYDTNSGITSGDDDFLMKKFAAGWQGSIRFLNDPNGIVTAGASQTLREFASQRLRWAGKWKLNFDASSVIALIVLGFHLCNILLVAGWLTGVFSAKFFALLAGAKLFAEVIFLFPICRFLDVRWSWISFFLLQLFYSLYVVSIGFLSQILTSRWKGREVITRADVQ